MQLSATLFTNIKSAAKQSNTEEQPDASCKIYGKSSGIIRCFFFTGIFQADIVRLIDFFPMQKFISAVTFIYRFQCEALEVSLFPLDLPGEGIVPSRQFDISKIDFDLLRREFAKAKTRRLILKDLDELIKQRLDKLLFSNPQRVNYYERYQQIIEDYNSEQNRATIEKTFMDLMDLANSMDKEEQRYVREGFSSDEELYLYDLLFSETLSKQDIQKIKQVAVDLLAKVKAKISELDHWTEKQETKAEVANLIRDTLWNELPDDYAPDKIVEFKDIIYQYVFTRYTDVA